MGLLALLLVGASIVCAVMSIFSEDKSNWKPCMSIAFFPTDKWDGTGYEGEMEDVPSMVKTPGGHFFIQQHAKSVSRLIAASLLKSEPPLGNGCQMTSMSPKPALNASSGSISLITTSRFASPNPVSACARWMSAMPPRPMCAKSW